MKQQQKVHLSVQEAGSEGNWTGTQVKREQRCFKIKQEMKRRKRTEQSQTRRMKDGGASWNLPSSDDLWVKIRSHTHTHTPIHHSRDEDGWRHGEQGYLRGWSYVHSAEFTFLVRGGGGGILLFHASRRTSSVCVCRGSDRCRGSARLIIAVEISWSSRQLFLLERVKFPRRPGLKVASWMDERRTAGGGGSSGA